MRVMVLVKATDDSEKGLLPTTEMLETMGKYSPGRTVIDGPFAETRELVAGFWLWEVKDMDEAVAWVKRCPNPMPGPSEIEIRPLYEMADLREHLTPEATEIHDRTRERLSGN